MQATFYDTHSHTILASQRLHKQTQPEKPPKRSYPNLIASSFITLVYKILHANQENMMLTDARKTFAAAMKSSVFPPVQDPM